MPMSPSPGIRYTTPLSFAKGTAIAVVGSAIEAEVPEIARRVTGRAEAANGGQKSDGSTFSRC